MTDTNPIQILSFPTTVMRTDVDIQVIVGSDGKVVDVTFDGRNDVEFLCPQHMSLLILHLKTKGNAEVLARFATHPIQFRGADGLPIPQPSFIQVQRASDFRCTLSITNTVIEPERYGFHAVFVHGKDLIGSPDPSINLDRPPCAGPDCEEPPAD